MCNTLCLARVFGTKTVTISKCGQPEGRPKKQVLCHPPINKERSEAENFIKGVWGGGEESTTERRIEAQRKKKEKKEIGGVPTTTFFALYKSP